MAQPKNSRKPAVKPYNMAVLGEDEAEINMYGQVVSIVPTDWFTGERLAGYIGLDEFLEDLENIKDKSKITVHINSEGGDLYAGLAIYNRLKKCKGQVVTINDGLAASAASLIFQAGDVRQMNAGSNLMAHGVSGFLFGFYNADDLKELSAQFKAHNKAIVNVYAERMGVEYDEAAKFVQGETWLTGAEAIEKGLADEVLEEEAEPDANNSLMQKLIAKARPSALAQFPELGNMATPAAVPPIADKTITETGGKTEMDIKNVTDLKNAFPDLVAQIEDAAKKEAIQAGACEERARIKSIEEIENSIADKDLVNSAKYGDNPMTAEHLALQAMKAQAQIGANMLNQLAADTTASGAEGVAAAPNNGVEQTPEEDPEAEAKNIANIFNTMMGGKK